MPAGLGTDEPTTGTIPLVTSGVQILARRKTASRDLSVIGNSAPQSVAVMR